MVRGVEPPSGSELISTLRHFAVPWLSRSQLRSGQLADAGIQFDGRKADKGIAKPGVQTRRDLTVDNQAVPTNFVCHPEYPMHFASSGSGDGPEFCISCEEDRSRVIFGKNQREAIFRRQPTVLGAVCNGTSDLASVQIDAFKTRIGKSLPITRREVEHLVVRNRQGNPERIR